MTTQAELEQLLAVGNESASFEVKGPGNLKDKAYVAKVVNRTGLFGVSGLPREPPSDPVRFKQTDHG